MGQAGDRWKRLVLHAQDHHGIVSRRRAMDLGISRDVLRRHHKAGRLTRMHRGVFALAGYPDTFESSVAAACEWGGEYTYAYGRTAARIHGLDAFQRQRVIELVTATNRRLVGEGIVVHRTDHLPSSHVTLLRGLRVTSVERTLLGLGSLVREELVEIATDSALRRGLTNITRLRSIVEEIGGRGRPGAATLRRLLAERDHWRPTDSSLETKMLRLLRRGGLPVPVTQHPVGTRDRQIGRVDFIYRDPPLLLEVDSYRYHSSRTAWQNDLTRQNALMADGRRILRFTDRDIEHRPGEVLDLIRSFFGH